MTSEDVQPNEIRLARKGSVTVPRIRPSRPTNAREPFKGTPRGRGGSHFGTTARPTARTTIWSTSNARAGPSSGGSWFPPHARPGSGGLDQHGPEHPQKKRRIEDHKRSPSFFAAGVPGPPFRGPQSHPKMLGKFKPVENFVDLPEDCWKSAPRCHSNRRAWVQRQVSLMQAEQKMQVINHAFLDFRARFECIPVTSVAGFITESAAASDSGLQNNTDTSSAKDFVRIESDTQGGAVAYETVSTVTADRSSQALSEESVKEVVQLPTRDRVEHGGKGLIIAEHPAQKLARLLKSSGRDHRIASFWPNTKLGKRESSCHLTQASSIHDTSSMLALCQKTEAPEVIDLTSDAEDHIEEHLPNTGVPYKKNVTVHGGDPELAARRCPSCPSFRSGSLMISREGELSTDMPLRWEDTEMDSLFNGFQGNSVSRSCVSGTSPSPERNGPSEPEVVRLPDPPPANNHPDPRIIDASLNTSCRGRPSQRHGLRAIQDLRAEFNEDYSAFSLSPPEDIVQLHKDSHDKSRKILWSSTSGILSVSMRGCIDRTEIELPRQQHVLMSRPEASRQLVDDACLLPTPAADTVVLGHARDTRQLTLVRVTKDNAREITSLSRPIQAGKKGGVSAVCAMMNPRTFATGGYDHVVHLWKLTEDSQGAIASPLAIRHASLVQSLLPICDTSCKLVSAGADCSVHLWDLSSERVVNTMKTSNSVYHVHKTLTSFSTLLEVAHRELQFEVRDHRLVPERPVQRFGYEASKPHGRYMKGDIRDGIFACGDREGNVRLWDLRNTAHALQVLPAVSGRKLAQVIFSDNYLVASSEDQRLAFMPCFGQP